MLDELRKVIPSFLRRVDLPERGGRWSDYLGDHADRHRRRWSTPLFGEATPADAAPGDARRLRSRRRGQAAGGDLLPAHRTCPRPRCSTGCARSAPTSGWRCCTAYVGDRENRRHKPGRAFERVDYRFDVLSDYGAFRDLQRHRHAHDRVAAAHARTTATCDRTSSTRPARPTCSTPACTARRDLYDALADDFPEQAAYAVAMAYRVRYVMQFNAREAVHLLELRSEHPGPPGLPAHRPRDAPADRRAGRPSRRRRGDDPPHHRRARARTPRRRAAGRGPPFLIGARPVDPPCDLCHRGTSGRRGSPPLSSAAWQRRMTTM